MKRTDICYLASIYTAMGSSVMQNDIKLTGVKWSSTFNWQPGMLTAQLGWTSRDSAYELNQCNLSAPSTMLRQSYFTSQGKIDKQSNFLHI